MKCRGDRLPEANSTNPLEPSNKVSVLSILNRCIEQDKALQRKLQEKAVAKQCLDANLKTILAVLKADDEKAPPTPLLLVGKSLDSTPCAVTIVSGELGQENRNAIADLLAQLSNRPDTAHLIDYDNIHSQTNDHTPPGSPDGYVSTIRHTFVAIGERYVIDIAEADYRSPQTGVLPTVVEAVLYRTEN